MVIGRAARRGSRTQRASDVFGEHAAAALDVLELLELAWHDCYGDVTPPDQVIDDLWVVCDGDLARLISAARLAVTDHRDLRVHADACRAER